MQLLGRTAAGAVVMPWAAPLAGRMAFATQVRTGVVQGEQERDVCTIQRRPKEATNGSHPPLGLGG
jgi:hypothetical protein